jgi:uncharacterized protein YjbJ (UPF0337 family)
MHDDEKEQVKGVGQQIKGKVKEEVGDLTDNRSLEIEGKLDKGLGRVREDVGRDMEREREGR